MLEDQLEERACLHALGLLTAAESRAFVEETAGNETLRRCVAELEDTLTNLTLSTTPIQIPDEDFRRRLLERIEAQPARVTTDRQGYIETINPAFTLMCGYRIDELRGRKPGSILQGPDSDPTSIATLREAVRAGYGCEVTLVNYHKNGSPYRVHIAIDPVLNGENRLVGFAATERKLTDEPA